MKTAILILSILLLIAGTIIFLQIRNDKMEEELRLAANVQHKDAIEKHLATAKSYADSAADVAVKAKSYRDSARLAQNALKSRIAVLMGRIRPQVPTTPQEDTVCERFIVAGLQKDTVINDQSDLIAGFEAENVVQDSTFASFRRFKDQEIAQKDTALQKSESRADNNFALYQKAEKQASKRWSLNVGAGYSVGPDGLGPHVGVQVGYDLVRFKFKK